MKIAFLLGAGVSLSAGAPCTADLTEAVLRVEDFFRHTDERFYPRGVRQPDDPSLATDRNPLLNFLDCIRTRCLNYFDEQDKHRGVNYEDIYFAASQLHEHILEEYENPILEPFTREVQKELNLDRVGLRDLAGASLTFINDVVASNLRIANPPVEHLKCLVAALRDESLDRCDVVTLNHDTLIERVLARESIAYVDGFGPPDGDPNSGS